MTFRPSYGFEEAFLYAGSDDIIPGMNKLAKACRHYDTPVFGQLFHAGRAVRLSHDGSRPLTYSASDVPDERYRVIPVPMPNDMVWELIDSYARAAERLRGFTGSATQCHPGRSKRPCWRDSKLPALYNGKKG